MYNMAQKFYKKSQTKLAFAVYFHIYFGTEETKRICSSACLSSLKNHLKRSSVLQKIKSIWFIGKQMYASKSVLQTRNFHEYIRKRCYFC